MGNEPKVIYIGDSVSWVVSTPDFPASDYDLAVYLRGSGSTAQKFTGSAIDSEGFAVTASVTGSQTGSFSWFLVFVDGADRITIPGGTVDVRPNPSGSGVFDPRSHVQKVLDAIQATIEGRASIDQMSLTINGRSLDRTPLKDLIALMYQYKSLVAQEEADRRISQGLSSGRKILVRFI